MHFLSYQRKNLRHPLFEYPHLDLHIKYKVLELVKRDHAPSLLNCTFQNEMYTLGITWKYLVVDCVFHMCNFTGQDCYCYCGVLVFINFSIVNTVSFIYYSQITLLIYVLCIFHTFKEEWCPLGNGHLKWKGSNYKTGRKWPKALSIRHKIPKILSSLLIWKMFRECAFQTVILCNLVFIVSFS